MAEGFSDAERAAMKELIEERKLEGRSGPKKAAMAQACLDAIAAMPDDDRVIAERVHAIVAANAPELGSKTWYGMPAYMHEDGKVVVFFKPSHKFESRYATLGFEDAAALDEGSMWTTSFALTDITDADAEIIAALVRKAVGG